jgi:hypothetical protein
MPASVVLCRPYKAVKLLEFSVAKPIAKIEPCTPSPPRSHATTLVLRSSPSNDRLISRSLPTLQQGSDFIPFFHPMTPWIIRKKVFASPDSMHDGIALHVSPTTAYVTPDLYWARVWRLVWPLWQASMLESKASGQRWNNGRGRRTEGVAGVAQTRCGDVGQQLHDNEV